MGKTNGCLLAPFKAVSLVQHPSIELAGAHLAIIVSDNPFQLRGKRRSSASSIKPRLAESSAITHSISSTVNIESSYVYIRGHPLRNMLTATRNSSLSIFPLSFCYSIGIEVSHEHPVLDYLDLLSPDQISDITFYPKAPNTPTASNREPNVTR
jgi:hypothetical protein